MPVSTLSLVAWLHVAIAATPWDSPVCTDPTVSPGTRGPELGTFAVAAENLEIGVSALQRAHDAGRRDDDAARQTKDALARLRFHPRDLALNGHVRGLSEQAMSLLADQALAREPETAQMWATYGLSRHGVQHGDVQAFVHELGPEPKQLYTQTQRNLAVATTAMIRINCDGSCSAFVDGQSISIANGYAEVHLMPGAHDVWVFDGQQTDRGHFETIDLDAAEQRCVIFSTLAQALPTRTQWWAASMFSNDLQWALSCKNNVVNCSPSVLEGVVQEWTTHSLVMSRSRSLRKLVVRGLLNLADMWVTTANAAQPPADSVPVDEPSTQAEQDGKGAVPEPAGEAIDTALAMGRFDANLAVSTGASLLPPINHLFKQHSQANAADGASIEIVCHQGCWPTIMGVSVAEGVHTVAPGSYFVEIHAVKGDEPSVGAWVTLGEGAAETVQFGQPPEPLVRSRPADVVAPVHDPKLRSRRVAFGATGAVALAAGALWTVGIAAGMIPNHKILDTSQTLNPEQRLRLGLYMSGAFSVHAILATAFFVSMPPSQRRGMPVVAAGAGLLATSAFSGGVAVVGGVVASNAQRRIDDADPNAMGLENRRQSGINTLIFGASAAGAFLVSGAVTLAIGRHRVKRYQSMDAARVKPKRRVSELRLSPRFGRELIGFGVAGKF